MTKYSQVRQKKNGINKLLYDIKIVRQNEEQTMQDVIDEYRELVVMLTFNDKLTLDQLDKVWKLAGAAYELGKRDLGRPIM